MQVTFLWLGLVRIEKIEFEIVVCEFSQPYKFIMLYDVDGCFIMEPICHLILQYKEVLVYWS